MQEFIDIFAEMGWASAILLVIGALLLIAEALTPGFNVAGVSGLICLVLGVIARVAEGASLTQTLLLILLVTIVVIVLFVLFVKSAKSGVLSKTSIIETGTAIPVDYGKVVVNANLKDKIGVTKTLCRPVGKVMIDNVVYDAITAYGYIEANKKVVVEKVGHDYLYLKEIKEDAKNSSEKQEKTITKEVSDNGEKQEQAVVEEDKTNKKDKTEEAKPKTTAKKLKKAD